MKKVIKEGGYALIETKKNTKMLILDDVASFAWIYAQGIGEILIRSSRKQKIESILSVGRYRLYNIKNEPKLTDLQHLELEVGKKQWQGYLLPNGLPTTKEKKHMIIPTYELVAARNGKNTVFDFMMERFRIVPTRTISIR